MTDQPPAPQPPSPLVGVAREMAVAVKTIVDGCGVTPDVAAQLLMRLTADLLSMRVPLTPDVVRKLEQIRQRAAAGTPPATVGES